VREWGPQDGIPLVLWPGLNITAGRHFDEAGPLLAAHSSLRVLAIDPPGWGTAALPDGEYGMSALARRLVALFDELSLEHPAYAGWSWGASIGCYLAAEAPERLRSLETTVVLVADWVIDH
jgi:pimeloyl-ACP methyl ester carboxylesterase